MTKKSDIKRDLFVKEKENVTCVLDRCGIQCLKQEQEVCRKDKMGLSTWEQKQDSRLDKCWIVWLPISISSFACHNFLVFGQH